MNWWVVPGWVLALVGFAFAYRNERRRQRERLHRQQRFEWDHVTQGVRQLCTWIERGGFKPDALVAIPGAGLIVTELAVIHWGDRLPVFMIQQQPATSTDPFSGKGGIECRTAKWRYWLPEDVLGLSGKRVLILDDYALSGDTLYQVRLALEANGFAKEGIRTAALISVRGLHETEKAPDYSWFWVDTYDVHMPWGHASKRIRTGEVRAA